MTINYEEMERNLQISKVEDFVKEKIKGYDGGHDWYHIDRVRRIALTIGKEEKVKDTFSVELAALLHDVGDSKFRKPEDCDATKLITELLFSLEVDKEIIDEVVKVNSYVSFSSKEKQVFRSDIFKIVQDADRLDAIGAMGIARAFNYGGYKNNPIYIPDEESSGNSKSTIGHFYDKLLKLKDLMNTDTGISIAEERHKILEKFLEQFFKEWNFRTCEDNV
jgi:uncharacterized protein